MSDFMRWLYANYIKPEVAKADRRGYEAELSSIESGLEPGYAEDLDRALEFYMGNAFLLGVRTGSGLKQELSGPLH